jgi:YhcN/YlaJ family sporulation lipoprotein
MKKILIVCIVVTAVITMIGCAGAGDEGYDYENDLNDNQNDNDPNNVGNYGTDPNYNPNNVRYNVNPNTNYTGDYTGYNNMGTPYNSQYNNGTVQDYGTNINYTNNANANTEQVEKQLENMEYVEDATCVINGDTALVGLDVTENCTGYRLTDVKNNTVSKVKAMCPGVTNISVTEDDSMYNRIDTLSNDIRSGKTIDNLSTQISNMVRNIVR